MDHILTIGAIYVKFYKYKNLPFKLNVYDNMRFQRGQKNIKPKLL